MQAQPRATYHLTAGRTAIGQALEARYGNLPLKVKVFRCLRVEPA